MTVTENRPNLARKHTRSTESKRASGLDEGIRITVADDVYEVRVGDLNALHERALRKQYGVSFSTLTDEFENSPGLDSIAAIVWLSRFMRGETDLTYDEVAVDLDLDFVEAMEIQDTSAETDLDSPEA